MVDEFRFSVGRGSALVRLETLLKEQKEWGYVLLTCEEFIEGTGEHV